MRIVKSALIGLLWAFSGMAAAGERVVLDGQAILMEGSASPDDARDDAEALRALARANPTVTKVVLSGEFLMTGAAIEAARVIEDFRLATEIRSQCTDACIYLFVSGKPRILAEGARIGLRRRMIGADVLRDGFEAGRARYGWQDEFGQAAMMYDRGQSDMRWAVLHLVERGVSLEFALRIFATPREDMWWPKRAELINSGVVAE